MEELVCTVCGTVGKPRVVTHGSVLIEIILWVCFIVPGLIYTIWRLTARPKACRACGSTQLVPPGSPMGRKLLGDTGEIPAGMSEEERRGW